MQAPQEMSPVRRAYETLRSAATATPFLEAEAREDLLTRLEKVLVKHREDIAQAASDDFGHRVRMESLLADVMLPLDGVRLARKHLREWMRRRTVAAHALFIPSYAFIEPVPLGVVGIISPWNYPVGLAVAPLIGALAAGNRVLLKPSELTPKTSALMAQMFSDFFRPEECAVALGGPEVAREVTSLPLDHLLFTGSTQVGRLVARAAAENLVPTTLELGGKSPVLVHESYSIERAASRIAMGKTFNGGQTCVAPDYALVPQGMAEQLAEKLKGFILRQHPAGQAFTSMVSDRAFQRMEELVVDARSKGARAIETFKGAEGTRVFGPVILLNVTDEMRVMQEEIFGPIFPVETYEKLEEAVARINARPKALSFYYFDDDQDRIDDLVRRVTAGGVSINDTMMHYAQEELAFGGMGASGMGAYHGHSGFETFSHFRSVLQASRVSAAYNLFKPPYSKLVQKSVDYLIAGVKGLSGRL